MSNTVEVTGTQQVLVTETAVNVIELQVPAAPATVEVVTAGPQGPAISADTPFDKLTFNTSAGASVSAGQLAWNATEGTLDVGTPGITYQLGQELAFRCKNVSADPISDGEAVMFMGADSSTGHLEIAHMVANGTVPGYVFFGVATEPIAIGALGYVTTLGKVRGIDTSAFPEDSLLWLDPAIPGGFTTVEPAAPNLKIAAAAVIKSHATNGIIFVRAETGRNIAQCHDVEIGNGAEDQQYLGWDETHQHWMPITVPNAAPRSITIAGPQIGDTFTLFRTDRATTISAVTALVQGSSNPSVTYELRYAADRSAAGTLVTNASTVTSITTGTSATVVNQPIATGSYVWVKVTAVSGAVNELNVSVAF